MMSYEQMAELVMKEGDVILERQKHRAIIIKRISLTISSVCAAAIVGIGVWHNDKIRNSIHHDPPSVVTEISETTTTGNSPSTLPITTITTNTGTSKNTTTATVSSKSIATEKAEDNTNKIPQTTKITSILAVKSNEPTANYTETTATQEAVSPKTSVTEKEPVISDTTIAITSIAEIITTKKITTAPTIATISNPTSQTTDVSATTTTTVTTDVQTTTTVTTSIPETTVTNVTTTFPISNTKIYFSYPDSEKGYCTCQIGEKIDLNLENYDIDNNDYEFGVSPIYFRIEDKSIARIDHVQGSNASIIGVSVGETVLKASTPDDRFVSVRVVVEDNIVTISNLT